MKTYKKQYVSYRLVREVMDGACVNIKNSATIADFIRPIFGDSISIYESMYLITLNQQNNIVSVTKISQGGITGTVVDIRLIAKYALDSLATGVILVHNHPSGSLKASAADINLTKKVQAGMELLDIRLLDHLILSDVGYISIADEGLM